MAKKNPYSVPHKVLIGEAAGEGETGMWHVASVMHNRVNKKRPSLDHVVNEPFQFSARARKDLDAFVGKQTPEVHAAAERAMARALELLAEAHKLVALHNFARMEQSIQAAIDNADDDRWDHHYDSIENDRELMHELRRSV